MFNRRPSVGPDDERNALAAEWRGLVPWFLRRLACTSFVRRHYHDLLSAGNMALIRAASLWRPERGAKFQSYAVHWIRGGVAKELRRLRSRRVRLFIDLSPDDNNDDDFAFDPAAPEREEQAPDLDRERLRMAVARIRPQYAHVLNRRYGLDGLCP